ncbi:unnamed protein product, partial [Meganyctiphanes norvegica]
NSEVINKDVDPDSHHLQVPESSDDCLIRSRSKKDNKREKIKGVFRSRSAGKYDEAIGIFPSPSRKSSITRSLSESKFKENCTDVNDDNEKENILQALKRKCSEKYEKFSAMNEQNVVVRFLWNSKKHSNILRRSLDYGTVQFPYVTEFKHPKRDIYLLSLRQLKKDKKIADCYVRHERVYYQLIGAGQRVEIRCDEDLYALYE